MPFARLLTPDHFLNGELGFSQVMYKLLITSQATNAQSAVMPRLISVLVVSDSRPCKLSAQIIPKQESTSRFYSHPDSDLVLYLCRNSQLLFGAQRGARGVIGRQCS